MITSKYSVKITRNIPKTWYHQYFPRTQPCILSKFSILPCCHHFLLLQNLGESFRIWCNPYSPPRLSLLASFFLSFFFQFLEDMRTTLRGWEWRWEQVNIGKKCGMKLMKHFYTFASLPPFIRPIKPCLTISILAL